MQLQGLPICEAAYAASSGSFAGVRFASVCFLCLFSAFSKYFCLFSFGSSQAAWQTGRQGNLLVAGIASYLLPLLPARMHHLPQLPPPPVPQMPSYWQWLNVARRSSQSRVFFVRCAAVFTFSLSPAAFSIVSHVAPHLVSGGAARRVWSVLLLCYACRSTIAPLIALISDLK